MRDSFAARQEADRAEEVAAAAAAMQASYNASDVGADFSASAAASASDAAATGSRSADAGSADHGAGPVVGRSVETGGGGEEASVSAAFRQELAEASAAAAVRNALSPQFK